MLLGASEGEGEEEAGGRRATKIVSTVPGAGKRQQGNENSLIVIW